MADYEITSTRHLWTATVKLAPGSIPPERISERLWLQQTSLEVELERSAVTEGPRAGTMRWAFAGMKVHGEVRRSKNGTGTTYGRRVKAYGQRCPPEYHPVILDVIRHAKDNWLRRD